MSIDVVVLRPESDFVRAGVPPPAGLAPHYTTLDDPALPSLLRAAPAMIVPTLGPRLSARLFENSALKLVHVTGVGVDRLHDAEATLKRYGIAVCNGAGGSNLAMVEYTISVAALLLRRFGWADAEIRAGRYAECRAQLSPAYPRGIEGSTVGIIGFGTIGSAIAQAFRQWNCRIVYCSRTPRPEAAAAVQAEALPLDGLLHTADIVSLNVPLLPSTRGLIGAAELACMKRDAVLINTSRGGVVDETALAAALQSDALGGAAVDVFASEPPAPGNPLLALTGNATYKLLLTPHIAGVTRQSSAELLRMAWTNVEAVVCRGEAPRNRVY